MGNGVVTAAAVAGPKAYAALMWFVGALVAIGLVAVLIHRFMMRDKAGDRGSPSMTRPVLAVLLVGAAVILAAASLGWDDSTTRNILIGGVVSLSSAAAAFYFASTNATEARRDLMQATATGMPVPDLHGKTIDQATAALRGTGLKLVVWDGEPASNGPITKQMPLGGTVISGSDSVVVRTT